MAVPKQHRSKSRQGQRRMHIHTKSPSLTTCSKCGKPVLAHSVCQICGYYKGREVIDVLSKLTKKERKKKEKEMAEKETSQKPLNMADLSKKQ